MALRKNNDYLPSLCLVIYRSRSVQLARPQKCRVPFTVGMVYALALPRRPATSDAGLYARLLLLIYYKDPYLTRSVEGIVDLLTRFLTADERYTRPCLAHE